MIRLHGTVEYQDGETETFDTGSAALAEWELFALRNGFPIGANAPPMLSSLVVAHHALGVTEDFNSWRGRVIGVELETEGVPPTLPVHSVEA